MDERWRKRVFPILPTLVEILIPLALIDRLLAVDLITVPEYERLSLDSIDDEKRSRTLLVSILPRKGPDSFDRFLNVLKEIKGQEHVAQKIIESKENEQKREEKITELERELEKERKDRTRERKEWKKCEVINIGLRNKIGYSKSVACNWKELQPEMPIDCGPSGRVAEINGLIHVCSGGRMYQLKEGAWEGKNHYLGFDIGSVFECEGKGYVMVQDGWGVCKSIYEWKSETRDLAFLTEIPHHYQLGGRSASGHNGNIYLVGGWGSDRVDCFDISKREWEPRKKMKNVRFECSLAMINDKMFVGGGRRAGHSVECYLTGEKKWINIKPTTKRSCELTLWNGNIIATGGRGESNCVELYDELSGDWLPLPSMNHGRFFHGACTTKYNQLVVVGGLGAGNSVECLKL